MTATTTTAQRSGPRHRGCSGTGRYAPPRTLAQSAGRSGIGSPGRPLTAMRNTPMLSAPLEHRALCQCSCGCGRQPSRRLACGLGRRGCGTLIGPGCCAHPSPRPTGAVDGLCCACFWDVGWSIVFLVGLAVGPCAIVQGFGTKEFDDPRSVGKQKPTTDRTTQNGQPPGTKRTDNP